MFCLWPGGAITHGAPSSHASSLCAPLFSQRSFLGQIAGNLYGSPSRRFIGQQLIYPLYTFQIIGLSQRDGGNRFEGRRERECNRKSKDTLSVFCAAASPPWIHRIHLSAQSIRAGARRILWARCSVTPTSLRVKWSSVTTGWQNECRENCCHQEMSRLEFWLEVLDRDNVQHSKFQRLCQHCSE